MSSNPHFRIEQATARDVSVILEMVRGLASYEQLPHAVAATEESLRATLFGERPRAEVVLVYAGDEPAGFAVYFETYSTFLAKRNLYLEDLFVHARWRGQGLGKSLMAHVARVAVERACGRVDWSVLHWNQPAIEFYQSLGARPINEWTVYRLSGEALARLAAEG